MKFFPKVINCLGEEFGFACRRLRNLIHQECKPDLFLGIESGGGHVLRQMLKEATLNAEIGYVKASRPKTVARRDRNWQNQAIALLPRWIADIARVVEHLIRERRFTKQRTLADRHVAIDGLVESLISKAKCVILIDDAVDTGSSVELIAREVKKINASAEIKVAAIVQTFQSPFRPADFMLYAGVLVRFPWSADAA